jgi:predicted DNA-binding protein
VKYVSIRFPVEVLEEVRELSREEHRSINGTVLEAVERYLRARRGRGQPSQPKDAPDAR